MDEVEKLRARVDALETICGYLIAELYNRQPADARNPTDDWRELLARKFTLEAHSDDMDRARRAAAQQFGSAFLDGLLRPLDPK